MNDGSWNIQNPLQVTLSDDQKKKNKKILQFNQ